MRWRGGRFWSALILLGCAGYQLLLYLAVNDTRPGLPHIALLLLPLLVLACWGVAHSGRKYLWLLTIVLAAAVMYQLEQQEKLNAAVIYGVPHAAAHSFLLWFFGRTLRHGKEPLISRLARRVHGGLPPYMELYTRRVTAAWCIFFAGQLVASALLFAFASLHVWSLFINIVSFPLVVLMFAGEYLYRVTRYRDYPHASIARSIRAFAEDTAAVSDSPKGR
jgi:uncharacterized membrane protein